MRAPSVKALVELDDVETLARGLDHPESVIWDPRRRVLFTGGEAGQIFSVALDGSVDEVANTSGMSLGLALWADGSLLTCDAKLGAVVRVDPDAGTAEQYSLGPGGRRFRLPNHVAVDGFGTAYVTDSGEWGRDDGAVFRIRPGEEAQLWSSTACAFPNGCALALGGRRLFVVESRRATVRGIAISAEGEPVDERIVARLDGALPDGIAVGPGGGLLVGCFRPDRVYRISGAGTVRWAFDDPWGMTIPVPTGGTLAGAALELIVLACHGDDQLVVASSADLGL